jgi:hypothetical protein
MGSRQGRATSVPANHVVIEEPLYGRVEIAAVSSSSKCFLPCGRHSRFLDQGSAEIQKSMRENLTCRTARCGTAEPGVTRDDLSQPVHDAGLLDRYVQSSKWSMLRFSF